MAIVNAGKIQPYESIPQDLREAVEDVVLNRRPDSTDRLLIFAESLKNQQSATVQTEQEWRKNPPIERLQYALKNGISDFIEEDMNEVLSDFSNPVEIIEGPLMTAMSEVGEQFGEGKLFLPQIVKSARVMKKAVAVLEPHIEAHKNKDTINRVSAKSGKILIATVKGDVHDIGKNIAGVVLACNGYEIMDLGVMIPAKDIVNTALEHHVDLIGLSGLITPSLDEMATVAKTMQEKNIRVPLVVGGASTSELHTAVYLNPLYDGGVYHAKDASHGAQIIRELMSDTLKPTFVERTQKHYENLKTTYESKQGLRSENAKKNQIHIDWNIVKTEYAPSLLQNFSLEKLVPYIDWRYFYHAWGVKSDAEEQQKLFDDATVFLDIIIAKKSLTANAVYRIFEYDNKQICAFACTILGADELAKKFENDGDSYSVLMVKTLADRLAEAFADYLNREKYHGTRIAVGYPSYPDHSQKKPLFDLLSAEEIIGIQLTETFMMMPVSSVCGLIIANH
jgi:5-methyltetrahydrofolate--homocysteine methyltransferase